MLSASTSAMLRTLIYADLFDYPLTKDEVWKWLIKSPNALGDTRNIQEKKGFYFLRGRRNIVQVRQRREKWSNTKLEIAKKIASFLKYIPTIKLVGVSGALAVGNAKKDDDIDLFIISSKGLIWTARFLTTLFIEFTGFRRHPDEEKLKNKICLNMFVAEDHLILPKNERDLFSAHEVLQMKPIYDKGGVYEKFIKANSWVKEYLPNAVDEDIRILGYEDIKKKNKKIPDVLISQYLNIVEKICRFFQLWYMKRRRTKEVITEGIIRFHPQDARGWILEEYYSRLKKYRA